MDELHDAIQDAQYLGAVTNSQRGPSAAFYNPTQSEINQFVEKQEKTLGTDWLNLENLLELPLGFYFFRRFCDSEQHGVQKLGFLVELTKFRALNTAEQRAAKAKEIWEQYCSPNYGGDALVGPTTGIATGTSNNAIHQYNKAQLSPARTANSSPVGTPKLESRGSTRFSLGTLSHLHAASMNSNSVVFWKRSETTMKLTQAMEIYRHAASENSSIGVGGDVLRRIALFLRYKMSSSPSLLSPAKSTSGRTLTISASSPRSINYDIASSPSLSSLGDMCMNSPSDSVCTYLNSNGSPRTLSTSDVKTCPITLFDELEGCVLCSLKQQHLKPFYESLFYRRLLAFLYLQARKVTEDDFTLLRVLGRGGFGMVNGCIKRTSASLYAMKVMNKKMIKKKHAEKLCLAERQILAMISSPFVVCVKYAFQTPEELFLVLDLRTGGDLSFHLNRSRFTEPQVQFWAAQILLGLQHLHEKNIVYRDLKPENILLDEKGNCSISDLGLAVEVTPTLAGRCGTRGYWAPEMLMRDEHGQRIVYNQTVDWWSYGCLVYELLYGKCPFRTSKAKALHEDKQQAYDKATLELTPTYDPKYFSPEAVELIQQLLIRDPKKRLGANGAEEVKNMKFFQSIDWAKMENLEVTPPFVPDNEINAASQADIGSFDITSVKGVKLSEQDQNAYSNWDFVCPGTFQLEAMEYLEWEVKHGPCTITPNSNSCCTIL